MRYVKRTAALLLAAVIFTVSGLLSLACGAADIAPSKAALEDYQHVLSAEDEAELLDIMYDTADKTGTNIGIIIADDLGGIDEDEYCEAFAEAYFGSFGSTIVLLIAEEGSGDYDWIYTKGEASRVYDSQQDKIFDAVYYGLDSGRELNFRAAGEQFCKYLVENKNGYTGAEPGDYSGIQYMATLDDYQYALSSSEKAELLELIQSTADDIGANIGVVLSDSLNGKSEERYTDDYMYEQFGEDSSSIVLMLVKEGTGNHDVLAFNKHAYDIYDSQYQSILDAVYRGMDRGSSPNYPEAIEEFCSYLANHKTGYVGSSGGGFHFHIGMGQIIVMIFAFIIVITSVNAYAARYKKQTPISARTYLDNSRTNFTVRQDIFVREFTTSHKISSSSSGGGRHGGGGGHSRSGGHSSHSGRSR